MESEDPEDDTHKDYLLILAAFRRFLTAYEDSAESWETMEEIISLRASFLINRVLAGLQLDFGEALDLIRNHNTFITDKERQERDILIAAIDNLVDFAASEEQVMINELPHEYIAEQIEGYEQICEKYNETFSRQENKDVLYAAVVAAWWLHIPQESYITYMTQGDERVRTWHLSLEGITYPKNQFPPELIPPIDWGCRCFLMSDGFSSVYASLEINSIKDKINPIFAESLATGGRIFSTAHPYFHTKLRPEIETIKNRIKAKFYYGYND